MALPGLLSAYLAAHGTGWRPGGNALRDVQDQDRRAGRADAMTIRGDLLDELRYSGLTGIQRLVPSQ
jgi:hypothetical protein